MPSCGRPMFHTSTIIQRGSYRSGSANLQCTNWAVLESWNCPRRIVQRSGCFWTGLGVSALPSNRLDPGALSVCCSMWSSAKRVRCETASIRSWTSKNIASTPLWRNPDDPGGFVEGSSQHSWCTENYHWYGLNKPLRHLGLLVVELSLSTIVLPETSSNIDGATPVAQIHILVKAEPGPWKWETVSLKTVLKLVKQSFNDSEHFAGAVKHCLTGSFPSSPFDAEMEKHLRKFYFKIVKPYVLLITNVSLINYTSLRNKYDIRFSSGLFSSWLNRTRTRIVSSLVGRSLPEHPWALIPLVGQA